MSDLLSAILILGFLSLPLILGWLVIDRYKTHRGATSCRKCGYELTGHIESSPFPQGLCPECGITLSDDTVLVSEYTYGKPAKKWIRIPAFILLLSPVSFLITLGLEEYFAIPLYVSWPVMIAASTGVGYCFHKEAMLELEEVKKKNGKLILPPQPEEATRGRTIRATMHIANYLENHPPSPPPTA